MRALKIIPDNSPDIKNLLVEVGVENQSRSLGYYFYGELKERLGIDIGEIYNMSIFPKSQKETLIWFTVQGDIAIVEEFLEIKKSYLSGRFPVEVYGIDEECSGIFWITSEKTLTAINKHTGEKRNFNIWRQCGLIFLNSDEKYISNLQEKIFQSR